MKRTIWMLAVLCMVSVPARAGGTVGDFSADIVSTTPQGTASMKIYNSGVKSRMEMTDNVVIVRRDLGVMWMVMPSQGVYMEQPINLEMAAQASADVQGEVSRESLGREDVNGKNAEKFKVTYEAEGRRGQIFQWMDGDMPVRTQASDGSWTVDFKNVRKGSQDASLFEPPSGLEKMAVPTMDELLKGSRA